MTPGCSSVALGLGEAPGAGDGVVAPIPAVLGAGLAAVPSSAPAPPGTGDTGTSVPAWALPLLAAFGAPVPAAAGDREA